MNFSKALELIKAGNRVQRSGWNGKDMFIFLVNGSEFVVNREPLLSIMGAGTVVNYRPHIDMKDAEGKVVPWIASQSDLMAEDWQVVGAIQIDHLERDADIEAEKARMSPEALDGNSK